MKLYGDQTSPFVRRVEIVARELGEPVERVSTLGEAGQAALREVSPIRKIPVAIIDGRTLFDSRVIIDWLTTTRGWGTLAPPRDRWADQNVLNALDGIVESLLQVLYLQRDGVAVEGMAYTERQRGRVAASLAWVAPLLSTQQLGLAEISAVCALDWIDFRSLYPTAQIAAPVRAAWVDWPSIAATRPG